MNGTKKKTRLVNAFMMEYIKTMTLDDLIKQPLSEEDKKIINEAQPVVTEECPEMSDEQLQQFRPWYEVHKNENDIYKVPVKKTVVTLKIDDDVLTALKAAGEGYKARINNILRKVVLG